MSARSEELSEMTDAIRDVEQLCIVRRWETATILVELVLISRSLSSKEGVESYIDIFEAPEAICTSFIALID